MSEGKMHGPFVAEIQIVMTNGTNLARCTWRLPCGRYPTKEDIDAALKDTERQMKEQHGDEWRLCKRPEFQNEVLSEHIGQHVDFASPAEWDPA